MKSNSAAHLILYVLFNRISFNSVSELKVAAFKYFQLHSTPSPEEPLLVLQGSASNFANEE
jgi:hypothetical protein